MHKRTKALRIPQKVKAAVWERDGGYCVLCGNPGSPDAHFIPRSQGGLGIEENVVTLCWPCHVAYDQTISRARIGDQLAEYLRSKYPDWDKTKLTYRK